MRAFFYGTMMDSDIRGAVLGAAAAARLEMRPARLPGYRCVLARHGRYPVLTRHGAGRVGGLLASGLKRVDMLRIAHFEGPYYRPARLLVRGAGSLRMAAWVQLPVQADDASRRPWDLRRWQLTDKRRLLADLALWMTEYERFGAHSVEISWPVRRLLAAHEDFEAG